MTHDELLAKIDANGTKYDGNTGITTEVVTRPHRNDKALRAVVELHRPVHNAYDTDYSWWGCLMCEEVYPCPTIQAIEKELE